MTNAEARFNVALRPQKPLGSLGRGAKTATSTSTKLLSTLSNTRSRKQELKSSGLFQKSTTERKRGHQ